MLSPAATEIEVETVRWIAELIGFPTTAGGILVSGGNMANFVPFFAARAAQPDWKIRAEGATGPGGRRLRAYVSAETHTWIQKAADLSGIGTDAVRWIPTGKDQKVDLKALAHAIAEDRAAGDLPFLVVGTAGSVSTGIVDDLPAIAALCQQEKLWFHVDGAYGGFAACVPEAPPELRAGIALADSVAVDPHKWLYAPIEAGCALVRDPARLVDAFSYHPPYYHLDEATNFVDYGMQNSRGFRALKVWLQLKHVGAAGYRKMIGDDIALARALYEAVGREPELEPMTLACRSRRSASCQGPARARGREGRAGIRQRPQPGAQREAAEGRRVVRLQCRARRPVRAARLHRQFPHRAIGRRGDARDRRARRDAPWMRRCGREPPFDRVDARPLPRARAARRGRHGPRLPGGGSGARAQGRDQGAAARSGERSGATRALLREARAASALNHPNIVTVHDVGEADGTLYVAMERIEGATLRDWAARRSAAEVLAIMRQAARALWRGRTRRGWSIATSSRTI
jgi:glutamate/tyrosine decarboxylase-like PLP-dependent enzyme